MTATLIATLEALELEADLRHNALNRELRLLRPKYRRDFPRRKQGRSRLKNPPGGRRNIPANRSTIG